MATGGVFWVAIRDQGEALSFFKASKTLLGQKIQELRAIIMLGKGTIEEFVDKFYDISKTNHLLEKRQKEPTSVELLFSCLSSVSMGNSKMAKKVTATLA